ncbi:hypothetical protein FNF31_05045 [Cafeteria roenbergensis]|uniref:NADPH--hemoprotein reductase n=1 Tax=Cafeteria roenbergensis TaxID=33653 RepID=A0A5A8D1H8_CAFRO|nr:hypothetical protein FNF31_05045 [Cafeteria roenbergensis]
MLARRAFARVARPQPLARHLNVLVGWGSHSGTATFLADQLADDISSAGMQAKAVDQREITLDTISKAKEDDILVFMNACFGQGEPTDNAKALYTALLDKSSEDAARAAVSGKRFAVFGLGASRTHGDNYQVVGRNLDARLAELGGQRLVALGEGDDSSDVEAGFDMWRGAFMAALKAAPAASASKAAADPAPADGSPAEASPAAAAAAAASATLSQGAPVPFDYNAAADAIGHTSRARVTSVRRLSAVPGPRAVYRIVMQPSATGVEYEVGDHISILPRPTRHAQRIAALLGFAQGPDADAVAAAAIGVEMTAPMPPGSLRALRGFIEASASSTTSFVASALDVFNAAIGRRPNVLEALHAASPWLSAGGAVSLADAGAFIAALPKIRPRLYSIASCHRSLSDVGAGASSDPVELVVRRVVRDGTSTADPASQKAAGYTSKGGVCSTWLTGTQDGIHAEGTAEAEIEAEGLGAAAAGAGGIAGDGEVAVAVRDAAFRLPEDPQVPIVLVAGGVGLAPMVGFWRYRQQLAAAGTKLGPAVLARCCADTNDAVLTDEINAAVADGALSSVVDVVAAGADGPLVKGGKLSPHPLVGEALAGEGLRDIVEQALSPQGNGHLYVCGGAGGFGNAVMHGVEVVVGAAWGEKGAVSGLFKEGRWHEDLAD